MVFSERYGFVKPREVLQIEEMDNPLRNSLWNEFIPLIKHFDSSGFLYEFAVKLWCDFWKFPLDDLTANTNNFFSRSFDRDWFIRHVKEWFLKAEWFRVYDIIDYSLNVPLDFPYEDEIDETFQYEEEQIINNLNIVLENEKSGYRLINRTVSPITHQSEIESLEESENITNTEVLRPVNIHLKTASIKFSDRENPDYRNSIKESISAVEAIVNIINGTQGETLGKAIQKLKTKINIHPSLEQAFSKMYGYTSDESGIRHPIKDADNCDFDDAKYMLVSCSAFINYLIGKAGKAELLP